MPCERLPPSSLVSPKGTVTVPATPTPTTLTQSHAPCGPSPSLQALTPAPELGPPRHPPFGKRGLRTRPVEVRPGAQSHTAGEWLSWVPEPDFDSSTVAVNISASPVPRSQPLPALCQGPPARPPAPRLPGSDENCAPVTGRRSERRPGSALCDRQVGGGEFLLRW